MYQTTLILHILGIAAGIGVSFFMAGVGIYAKTLPEDEGIVLIRHVLPTASRLGTSGYVLLIVTGPLMLWQTDWAWVEAGGHWFRLKMALVVVLGVLLGWIHVLIPQAQKSENPQPALAKIELLGKIALATSIAIIISAILAFR